MSSVEAKENLSAHYDEKYFEWQRRVGEFTSVANRLKFEGFAGPDLRILDFGCGGGFMLKGLPAKERRGVEINPVARAQAIRNGVDAVASVDEVPEGWADLIISDHALEHVPDALEQLKKLRTRLRLGGRMVIVIPCENIDMPYDPNDLNQHLYSWGPQSLGNLFKAAGFKVLSSRPFFHKHVPYSHRLRPLIGERLFNLVCYLYGRLNWSKSNEVRLIAERVT